MVRVALRIGGGRVAAIVAMLCATLGGAALLTGTGVLAESGLRSHVPPGRLAAADLVVAADQSFRQPEELSITLPERAAVPADVAGRVARIPGVVATISDVSFPAALVVDGKVVPAADPLMAGHGWASTALLPGPRVTGRPPAGADEVAVDTALAGPAGVRPGDRVQVVAGGRSMSYRVSALVAGDGAGLLFADATARRLAGRAGPDLVAIQVEPGAAARVAEAVRADLRGTGLVVAAGAARGDVSIPAAAASRSLLLLLAGSLGGIVLLVVGFMVAGAMTVSIGGQRHDLALLRAVGATPRQIRRLAAAQATLVAAVAAVPGVALGYLLADRFRALLVDAGMLPDVLPLTVSPLPALVAVLLILGAAQVSARSAAWRVSRRPATEAVAESRSEPRAPAPARTAAGLLLIVGALALSTVPLLARTQLGASATPLAGILAAIGLTLAGPDLVRRTAAAAARRLPARVSAPTWLAVSNSHGYALRIAGAVTTLGMAVLFTLTYTLTQTTLADAVDADVRAAGRAQATLSAPALGGVPEDLATAVRDVPGVRAVAPVGSTTVLWPGPIDGTLESTSALILTPDAAPLLDLGIRAGGLDRLTGTTIAIDSATASTRRLSVGRTVAFVLGDGARVTAEVVAVYDRGLGFGPVVLSRDLTTGHTATATGQILIGTDGSPATTQALTALVSDQPGTELTQGTADSTGTGGGPPPEVWINLAVLAVLLGYLLLGIANKLIAATAARRTELAVLRLVGTTPRQIRAMMRREATLIVIAAVTAGGLLAAVPLALLGQSFLHRPWPAGPIWLAPVTVLVVATIALLTTELPTRQALRIPPTTELGVRG